MTRPDIDPDHGLICATVEGLPGPWRVTAREGDTCRISCMDGSAFRLETTHVDNVAPFYTRGPQCGACPHWKKRCGKPVMIEGAAA